MFCRGTFMVNQPVLAEYIRIYSPKYISPTPRGESPSAVKMAFIILNIQKRIWPKSDWF